MSRERSIAIDAFVDRLHSPRRDPAPDGPRLPDRRAVRPAECGPETNATTRAAAALYARLDRSEHGRSEHEPDEAID